MRKTSLVYFITSLIIITAVLVSCIEPDYFTVYSGKNLIGHKLLSDWTISQNTTYMTYEAVSSTVAGTSGLPDETSLIYRLENKNLLPNGDFEATTVGNPPALWTETGGTHTVENTGHHLNGKALRFEELNTEYLTFDFNNLTDTGEIDSTYVFRLSLEGTLTGSYFFEIDDTSTSGNLNAYPLTISQAFKVYELPDDFTIATTSFLLHTGNSDVFRINYKPIGSKTGISQTGYIDNFRVVKADQTQELSLNLSYTDADRVDSLTLISGTYRFSVYVKADPEAASTNNRFNSSHATLTIQAFDPDGSSGSIAIKSFSASDYSSFTDWTQIYIDAILQIHIPLDTTAPVIKLSASPCDSTGGVTTLDAGSLLISNPVLLYSENGVF